jgi:hypothetical protein
VTEHDKLKSTVLDEHVQAACHTFIDELIAGTVLAIYKDPRSHGLVTLKDHDARVSELLSANTALVNRARDAEHKLEAAMSLITDVAQGKPRVI